MLALIMIMGADGQMVRGDPSAGERDAKRRGCARRYGLLQRQYLRCASVCDTDH
jgi:hypothetical protein